MKLVVGLGNLGRQYENTRHNVGYFFIDKFSQMKSTDFISKKTDVFMNDSGSAVKKFVSQYQSSTVSDLYIVHDDLDISLGKYKIQFGTGPKDHNGVNSVNEALGTKDYWRVRIGIENRPALSERREPKGEEYTLQNFTEEERKIIDSVIKEICKKLATS